MAILRTIARYRESRLAYRYYRARRFAALQRFILTLEA